MKLCKDCKHFGEISKGAGYCKHPKADFNVVDGSPETYCFQARGQVMVSDKSVCWPNAKLFEQAPPADPKPEMQPYAALFREETERDRSFWEKAKHWFC